MTDNDIIKALEKCANLEACEGCPMSSLDKYDTDSCERQIMLYALSLINRLKAEIERLVQEKDNLIKTYKECMTEAITEFERRLVSCGVKSIEVGHFDNKSYEFITIRKDRFDQTAKEMKGGEEE